MIFGIGTDLIEIDRIKRAVEKNGDRFLRRVYTRDELEYCLSKKDPYPCLAARFAAKEAVFKALGTGVSGSRWIDVAVLSTKGGKPETVLSGGASRIAADHGVKCILLSLSHCRDYAVAFAVAESMEV